jgi:hypothetical protein
MISAWTLVWQTETLSARNPVGQISHPSYSSSSGKRNIGHSAQVPDKIAFVYFAIAELYIQPMLIWDAEH